MSVNRAKPKRPPGRPRKQPKPIEILPARAAKALNEPVKVRKLPVRITKLLESPTNESALHKHALRDLFGLYREKAVMQIAALATRSKSEDMRFAASKYILDRSDGPIPREVTGKDGAPLIPKPVDDRPKLAVLLGIQMANALGVQLPDAIEGEVTDSDDKLSATKDLDP